MAERNWNPNEPSALGLEWAGMRRLAVPLTQEVEYGHTFQSDATEAINSAAFEIVGPSVSNFARTTALITVYERDSNDVDETGNELEYGIVTSTMVACNGGTVTAPAALAGGAATLADAVSSPSDAKYVDVTGGSVDLEFATAGLFTGKRILEVKFHYSAEASVANDAPTATLNLRVGGTGVLLHAVAIDVFGGTESVRQVTFGEVNYGSGVKPLVWPWTVADVGLFDSTTVVRFTVASPSYGLEYAALEVVWCEENRAAVGALVMGPQVGQESMAPGVHTVNLRLPDGTDNWTKVVDEFYTVTVTAARAPTVGLITQGEAPLVPLIDGFEVFENHQGRVAPRLITNVLASAAPDSRITPIRFTTTSALTPTDFAPYDNVVGAPVYNGSSQTQEIEERSGGTNVHYPWIRFYARIIGDPADVPAIDITTVDGAMNYFATSLLALPEIFDGWREVTLKWPTSADDPQLDNTSADYQVTFSTTQGDITNRWEILGVTSALLMAGGNGGPTYGQGNTSWIPPAGADQFADLAVTLHTEPATPTGFAVGATSLPLTYLDVSGGPGYSDIFSDLYDADPTTADEPCFPSAFPAIAIEWDSASGNDDFAYWEIARTDDYGTDTIVAQITDIDTTEWVDYEAQVGVESSYRMRMVRNSGIYSQWTAADADTPELVATCLEAGALFFSSNVSGDYLLYPEMFEGEAVEDFQFVEAGWVTQQRVFGRFGQTSFHPTERGGVTFERTILTNALATPALGTADNAFSMLRDLAWADVPYVCVKDDQGNRWYATLIVPDGNIRRRPHIHFANIQVIEATQTPFPAASTP